MESNQFDGAFKKKESRRAPRRRQAAADEDPDSSVPTGPAAEPSGPKKSGWGDSPGGPSGDSGDSKPGRRRRAADNDDDEPEAPEPTRHAIASMDDEEPAGFIPDLEDEEEDMGKQLAVAPSLKSSRVQTIMELDEEIDSAALPSASEVGVDLSVLQSFLTPQEHVLEEDVPWDVEHELQTIASDFTKEKEERDGTALTGMSSPTKKKAMAAATEQDA